MKVTDTNLIDYVRLYYIPFPIIYGYKSSLSEETKLQNEITAMKNAKKAYTSEKSGANFIYTILFKYCYLFLNILGGDVLNHPSKVDLLKLYQSEQASINKYLEIYRETTASISKTEKISTLVTKMYQSFKTILSVYIGAYRELTEDAPQQKNVNTNILDDIINSLGRENFGVQEKNTLQEKNSLQAPYFNLFS